jgi:hypothetical protein
MLVGSAGSRDSDDRASYSPRIMQMVLVLIESRGEA